MVRADNIQQYTKCRRALAGGKHREVRKLRGVTTQTPERSICHIKHVRDGAIAGVAGIVAWLLLTPLDKRLLHSRYDDVELLGMPFGKGRLAYTLGIGAHTLNGALFGALYACFVEGHLQGPGWLRGLLAAESENLVLSPLTPLLDRVHPSIRQGRTGKTATPAALVQGVIRHALFGVVLGSVYATLQHRSHSSVD